MERARRECISHGIARVPRAAVAGAGLEAGRGHAPPCIAPITAARQAAAAAAAAQTIWRPWACQQAGSSTARGPSQRPARVREAAAEILEKIDKPQEQIHPPITLPVKEEKEESPLCPIKEKSVLLPAEEPVLSPPEEEVVTPPAEEEAPPSEILQPRYGRGERRKKQLKDQDFVYNEASSSRPIHKRQPPARSQDFCWPQISNSTP
ncbi:apical membrane antigen 1-like protein [Schistocerca cancellata]|uniref:apical membrane antigen 1-like protein n=1 Tax=Schistocerca cancellata TaxID=274614 RepID=UPI00211843B5|nr:apical membrane antigen 1-like protein [Schistocerca cancellata]